MDIKSKITEKILRKIEMTLTSLLHQNDVTASLWRSDNVIITLCGTVGRFNTKNKVLLAYFFNSKDKTNLRPFYFCNGNAIHKNIFFPL